MDAQSIVLSFHETLLHQSDVDLLTGPYWLNDTIISFYFEYLERVKYKSSTDVLFVSPEVTQCIKMVGTEEIGIFLHPLEIDVKEFVFFALNDNNRPESAGGTHWSLLVYSRPECSFFHLDSSSGSNKSVARQFSRHLAPFLARDGSTDFVSKCCTQQNNSYDCGVHVTINTELIADHLQLHKSVDSCDTSAPVSCSAQRKHILNLIQSLAGS